MTVSNSTAHQRPEKPFPEFPLFAHSNGQWGRKIRGRVRCFGVWADPQAALERHNKEYPYLKAGVPVPDSFDGLTIKALCDRYLNERQAEADAGQVTQRHVDDLHLTALALVATIDKRRPVESITPDDLAALRLAVVKDRSPVVARNFMVRIRSILKYAYDRQLIDRPVPFGSAFKLPTKAQVRKHRAAKGRQLWTPQEIWTLLAKANRPMAAMIWLGLNCGVNNADLCALPLAAVQNGVFDFARTKTGIERRVPLWPETQAALRAYLNDRPNPQAKADKPLLFITRWGNRWRSDSVTQELQKLTTAAGIEHGSFAWFRKTFQTIAENCGDLVAVRAVMGHVDGSISDHYRQEITQARIDRATGAVRDWLMAGKPQPKAKAKATTNTGGNQ